MTEESGIIADNFTLAQNVSTLSILENGIICTLMTLLILVTIIGNILVILSVFTHRPLRNVQNFFIVSLACSDLAVAIVVMPFHVIDYIYDQWVLGAVFCELWLTSDILCCTSSILNLCAIAMDRYYAIHDPINYSQKRTLKRVLLLILLVWSASTIISVPPLFGWNSSGKTLYDENNHVCHLTDEKSYVVYSACGSFYVPLVVMSVVYLKIFLAVRQRLRQRTRNAAMSKLKSIMKRSSTNGGLKDNCCEDGVDENGQNSSETSVQKDASEAENSSEAKRREKQAKTTGGEPHVVTQFLEQRQRISLYKERKAARTLGVVMGAFVLCWLPFFLMYIIVPFCDSCVRIVQLEIFFVWLGYINSGLNPLIYTVFNSDFRKAFKKLLCGWKAVRNYL